MNRFLQGVVDTFLTAPKKRAVHEPAQALRAAAPDAPLTEAEENLIYETVAEGLGGLEAALRIAEGRGAALALQGLTEDDMANPRALAAFEDEQGETPTFRLVMTVREVVERIHFEFDSFAPHVQTAFSSTAQLNKVRSFQNATSVTSYAYIRSRLWKDGFKDPGKIFKEIVGPNEGATLLGRPIQNGVHRLFLQRLGDLAAEPLPDEAHAQLAPRIKDIIGFQPRRIAGRENLSNHVYGLAIDINATWSPHIKSPYVIDIIKRHTVPPIDFGTAFVKPGQPIDGIDAKLAQASEQMLAWLRTAMKTKTRLETNASIAETRASAAESAAYNAKTDDERASARDALDKARGELTRAQQELDASQDVFEVNELLKEWPWVTLENWQRIGLFTIPIELAKQLKARGIDWGAEWSTHKDVMHFEVDPRLFDLERSGDFPIDDSGTTPA